MKSQWQNVGECIRLHRGIKRYEVCVFISGIAYRQSFDFLEDAKDQRSLWYRLRAQTPRTPEKRNPDDKPEIGRNNTILRMQWTSRNIENYVSA